MLPANNPDRKRICGINIARLIAESADIRSQEHFAELMGVRPTGIRISSAKKRFGSCSPKNSISYSWQVMLYPDELVDYVIVHELAHIKHKNHGKDFYAFIASVMPDHKERRRLLSLPPKK